MTVWHEGLRDARGLWERLARRWEWLPFKPSSPLPTSLPPVFVAATYWTVNGVNVFSANLVRGLNRMGFDARVLITEQDSDLITFRERLMPRASDIPFESLGHDRSDGWGSHWGRMVRFLSDRAPCIYIPNSDWRHSCVCPRLPNDVIVVGVVHSDDPLHYNHVGRLGHTWNAVTAVSRAVAERTVELCPDLADRITLIPIGARIPPRPPARDRDLSALRLIYHGVLKQHQKRVLDLPRIVQAAVDRAVPVELTIVGAGPDEEALRAAAAPLVERGRIRFHGVAAPDDVGGLLAGHDVYLLASEFEGLPNALIEAMGQGCVPLVTRMTSGVPEVVRDRKNGLVVPIGDIDAFADRLDALWRRPRLRRRLSKNAYRTVSAPRYDVDTMVASYARVCARACQALTEGRFVRTPGELDPPPAEVAGVSLFPVPLPYHLPGIGVFPSADDAQDYELALRAGAEARHEASVDGMKVFIACPVWLDAGVSGWAEDTARGLRAAGLDARLLFTEESTRLVQIPGRRLDRPDDIPCEDLTLTGPDDGWGARWGAMVRLLERAAPCFYIPHFDWRHSCVTPLLSNDVMVIGIAHTSEPAYIDQVRRLGRSWNAIVATNRDTQSQLRREVPTVSDRTRVIPHGLAVDPGVPAPVTGAKRVMVLVHPERVDMLRPLIVRLLSAPAEVVEVRLADTLSLEEPSSGATVVVKPNRQQWLQLCRESGVVVAASSTDGPDRLVVEAMAHGCVPALLSPDALAVPPNLTDALTGLPAPSTADGVVGWVTRLLSDESLRSTLSSRARVLAANGSYSLEQMVLSYLQLLRRVRGRVEHGIVPERSGRIEPPPASLDGMDILPVPLIHETPFGAFPSAHDAERFESEAERRQEQQSEPNLAEASASETDDSPVPLQD